MLQHLHDSDDQPWADGVADDPARAHFAFSHGGVPFFIVGLHPKASRIARRTPVPVLVFNLHEQFERLRAEGGYERMRDKIRQRDQSLQGSLNPMVDDHGSSSEARQYAGRKVGDDVAGTVRGSRRLTSPGWRTGPGAGGRSRLPVVGSDP